MGTIMEEHKLIIQFNYKNFQTVLYHLLDARVEFEVHLRVALQVPLLSQSVLEYCFKLTVVTSHQCEYTDR